ncbi:hypothetical protein [Methylocystis iwaonis]|uniref:Uncharacterized protein n=1 Tax=Methylocystis iwaonis TaxID=2885079 RepID=A0ABM8ECF2_9HYPH|nr:hypothetical protein [Methylocystis iwaonis]BDV35684.1 hypothetical protein SS37A_32130 [Methylocystis iwaonis]
MTEFEEKTLQQLEQMNETLKAIQKIMQSFADQQEHQRRMMEKMARLSSQYGTSSR